MAQQTRPNTRSFSGTVGAGLGAVFGNGKPYFMLEHKDNSRYYRRGQTQTIIVDNALLGRDSNCQVRFDDASFPTVSRRHAAIVREGDQWKLVHLSDVNPTFVNGEKVVDYYYLQNGDEIQLSLRGPRMGFIIPPPASSDGAGYRENLGRITDRLGLFWDQAIRPYKTALIILGILLLLTIGGILAWEIYENKQTEEHFAQIEQDALDNYNYLQAQDENLRSQIADNLAKIDELENRLNGMESDLDTLKVELQHETDSLWTDVNKIWSALKRKPKKSGSGTVNPKFNNPAIDGCSRYVYYIRTTYIELKKANGNVKRIVDPAIQWSGSAFLLEDGRLVTARHVVEPWMTKSILLKSDIKCPKCQEADVLKYYRFIQEAKQHVRSGGRIIVHFSAVSPSSYVYEQLQFTNEEFQVNRRDDVDYGVYIDRKKFLVDETIGHDWAYVKTNHKGGLKIDINAAESLDRGVDLVILGYPFGSAATDEEIINFTPIISTATTSAKGLNNGLIYTTASGAESGCSGGPVFYTDNTGNMVVVGIISSGGGRSTGLVVPISALY
ncbi:MAG: FHA domain-containing protein [Tannerella sp.]|jgi:hypothetical protein|nr:FHA domain-containing protein [Tannerella sp.]